MAGQNFTISMVLKAVNQLSPVVQQAARQLQNLQKQVNQLNQVSNKGTWFDKAIVGVDNLSKKLKTAQESMDKLVHSGEKSIMSGTIMALPLVGMIKSAAEVQNKQASLQLTGMTSSQVNNLTLQAQQTMRKTMFNTSQVLGIDQSLAQVGMNYAKISNVGQSATYLAELEANRNGADPNETAKQFAQMAEQLQISMDPKKVKQLADLVNRISTVTSASVATLSDSSRYFNMVGKIQGLNVSDILMTQGLAARFGLEGSIGGTHLKDFFQRLNPYAHMGTMAGKPIVEAFQQLGWLHGMKVDKKGKVVGIGGDVFHDAKGNLLPAQQIFGILGRTYQHMGNREQFTALLTRILGQQGQDIAAAVAQNPQAFGNLQTQMKRVPTVNQGISAYQKTFNQQFHAFTSTLADFGRQMGTLVLPQLTKFVAQLNASLPKVQQFIDKHKALLKVLLQVWGGLAAFKIGKGILSIAVGAPLKDLLGVSRGMTSVAKGALSLGKAVHTSATAFRVFRGTDKFFTVLWTSLSMGFPKLTALGSGIFRAIGFIARISGLTKVWAGVQWLINAAMDANPVALIIMGIAALIGVIVLLVTHWKTVISWIEKVWNWYQKLGDKVKWAIAILMPFIGIPALIISKWSSIMGFFDGLWKHISPVLNGIGKFFGIGGGSSTPVLVGSKGGGNAPVTIQNNYNIKSTNPKQAANEVARKQKYVQSRDPRLAYAGGR